MIKALLKVPKIYLELSDCKQLFVDFHDLIDFEEPIPDFETRYEERLESVLGTVKQTFMGKLLYPNVLSCAAAYLVMLNRSHPFRNGNKRLSVLFTHIFLLYNGINLTVPEKEMFDLAIVIAKAGELGVDNDKLKLFVQKYILNNTKVFRGKLS